MNAISFWDPGRNGCSLGLGSSPGVTVEVEEGDGEGSACGKKPPDRGAVIWNESSHTIEAKEGCGRV